jgi:hypothetical protein
MRKADEERIAARLAKVRPRHSNHLKRLIERIDIKEAFDDVIPHGVEGVPFSSMP